MEFTFDALTQSINYLTYKCIKNKKYFIKTTLHQEKTKMKYKNIERRKNLLFFHKTKKNLKDTKKYADDTKQEHNTHMCVKHVENRRQTD